MICQNCGEKVDRPVSLTVLTYKWWFCGDACFRKWTGLNCKVTRPTVLKGVTRMNGNPMDN